METSTIELTQQEANVLITLIDTAVKARGLEVAQAAVALQGRIQQAFAVKPEEGANDGNAE